MLKKRGLRRITALSLVVAGGVFIYLAPADLTGGVLLALGIILEVAGIALERQAKRKDSP